MANIDDVPEPPAGASIPPALRPGQILILDGGMGTTLEDSGANVSGAMWGSELVAREPAVISKVHADFASAGADIVSTATYQMTVEGCMSSLGITQAEAEGVLRSAVAIAKEAAAPAGAAVALALGPYGATLSPGQEYSGYYPPPYGPKAFTADGPNVNTYPDTDAGHGLDTASEKALADFHLRRLQVFAGDETTWRALGWVAFETIPLLREIRAIRRAMAEIYADMEEIHGAAAEGERAWWRVPFWITSAYPGGAYGEVPVDARGTPLSDVADALLFELPRRDGGLRAVRPDGVGVNCTNPAHIVGLGIKLSSFVSSFPQPCPALVLYPDGGAVYDVVSRTWTEKSGAPAEWAEGVMGFAKEMAERERAGEACVNGVIVGGCCKTGVGEIAALRALQQR